MAIDKALYLFSDTRALRLSYFTDTTKYVDVVTTSAGGLTVTPAVAAQTLTLGNTLALAVGGTLAVTGTTSLTGALSLTVALTVANGGTGLTTYTAAGRILRSTAATTTGALALGTARQLLQVNSGATDLEWASNIDIPGTLDVTGAAVLDSTLEVSGNIRGTTANGFLNWLGDSDATVNMRLTDAGLLMIGDTANANMAIGLTINQGANDNQAFALKSSDVASGLTSITSQSVETDDYFTLSKSSATLGGTLVQVLAENGALSQVLRFGIWGGAANTAKTTSGLGLVDFAMAAHNGANAAANIAATGNLLSIRGQVGGSTLARFLFDIDGYLYIPGATTTDRVGNGLWFINDSSNANMTLGLTINQGANDNEIWTLKSSDVVHTSTTDTEADTYAFAKKWSPSQGGLRIDGYSEGTVGVGLTGVSTSADTAKNTSAVAPVTVRGTTISGTAQGDVGANGNLMVIRDNNTTRFIFDAEGDGHADVSWTTFDQHPDLALIEDMETLLAPGHVQRRFGEMVRHDRAFFEREGLLHAVREVAPGKMRGMLNTTRAHMLAFGAIRQVGGDVAALRSAFVHLLDNPNDRDGALRLLEA